MFLPTTSPLLLCFIQHKFITLKLGTTFLPVTPVLLCQASCKHQCNDTYGFLHLDTILLHFSTDSLQQGLDHIIAPTAPVLCVATALRQIHNTKAWDHVLAHTPVLLCQANCKHPCSDIHGLLHFIHPCSNPAMLHSNLAQHPVHALCSNAPLQDKPKTASLVTASTPMRFCTSHTCS